MGINTKRLHLVLILFIILTAAWLRLWRLPDTPPGLEYDEAINGLDALWMVKTGTPYLFVNSTQGREALFLYPIAFFTSLLGASPLTLRLTSVFVGILTIPLLYRLTLLLFREDPWRGWLALVAALGLAVSFWHIAMSRVAFRAILVLPAYVLLVILFWSGWWSGLKLKYLVVAGLVLGLSQYTYIPARLFPVLFILFAAGFWFMSRSRPDSKSSRIWPALLLVGGVGIVVFTPLALLFWHNPDAFGRRVGQVTFQTDWSIAGVVALARHIGQGLMLFFGGADPRIRHHLIERPVFDGLVLISFWVGTIIAIRRWRQPAFLFLLLSIVVLWLPGPLSIDPIHNLRTAGILPAFFIVVAVGMIWLTQWGLLRLTGVRSTTYVGLISLGLVGLVSGGASTFDYFIRWANHPLVYQEYKGPSIELAQYAAELSHHSDVILPYEIYAYPPVRYVMRDRFRETLPISQKLVKPSTGAAIYLNWLDDRPSPLLVRLTYDQAGQGLAYLFASPDDQIDDTTAGPVLGRRGNLIGKRQVFPEELVDQLEPMEHIISTSLIWGDYIHLAGYQLTPAVVAPGQAGVLTLFWDGLREADLKHNVFIQILNNQGQPVTQLEERVLRESIQYYESRDGFVPQQHRFWLGPELSTGLYLARIGLFEPTTGQRLPIILPGSEAVGDQIILAAFYVFTDSGIDPRLPETELQSNLGQEIELVGYSLESALEDSVATSLNLKLYWRAVEPVDLDYTAFVQLLDEQNQVVGQLDSQPLGGLYPTSRWQPGQIIIGEYPLSINQQLGPGSYRLVTGMYDLTTGLRLPALDANGQPWPDNAILLTRISPP